MKPPRGNSSPPTSNLENVTTQPSSTVTSTRTANASTAPSLCDWFGVPPDWSHDNEAYKAGIAANLEHGSIKTCEVFNLTIDVDARKSAAMSVSNMVFKDGEELIMEHAWALDFNDDGSKIVKVVEFCDQLATRRMVSKVHPGQFGDKN